jgi:hypothetical protein
VRLLARGGRIAAAVWGESPQVPLISVAREVLRAELGAEPPPGMPTPFDLAEPAALRRRLERAGLEEIAAEWRTVRFEFDSADEYPRFVREVSTALPALDDLTPERREEVWAAVARAARSYAGTDGRVRMDNQALLVAGVRPAESRTVRCPFCGGTETRLESQFGSTLGFAQYWCEGCRTVFEYIKWEEERPGA